MGYPAREELDRMPTGHPGCDLRVTVISVEVDLRGLSETPRIVPLEI